MASALSHPLRRAARSDCAQATEGLLHLGIAFCHLDERAAVEVPSGAEVGAGGDEAGGDGGVLAAPGRWLAPFPGTYSTFAQMLRKSRELERSRPERSTLQGDTTLQVSVVLDSNVSKKISVPAKASST